MLLSSARPVLTNHRNGPPDPFSSSLGHATPRELSAKARRVANFRRTLPDDALSGVDISKQELTERYDFFNLRSRTRTVRRTPDTKTSPGGWRVAHDIVEDVEWYVQSGGRHRKLIWDKYTTQDIWLARDGQMFVKMASSRSVLGPGLHHQVAFGPVRAKSSDLLDFDRVYSGITGWRTPLQKASYRTSRFRWIAPPPFHALCEGLENQPLQTEEP